MPFRKYHGGNNTPLVIAMKTKKYLENKLTKDMLGFYEKFTKQLGWRILKISTFKRCGIFLDDIDIIKIIILPKLSFNSIRSQQYPIRFSTSWWQNLYRTEEQRMANIVLKKNKARDLAFQDQDWLLNHSNYDRVVLKRGQRQMKQIRELRNQSSNGFPSYKV